MTDYSNFPWSYPELFTNNILFNTDFPTILACRQVSMGWKQWFDENQFWKQYLKQLYRIHVKNAKPLEEHSNKEEVVEQEPELFMFRHGGLDIEPNDPNQADKITRYRLERLLFDCDFSKLTEQESFSLCSKVNNILQQLEKNLVPKVSKCSLETIGKLKQILNEETFIKSFGPTNAFLRLKVNNPIVKKIITELIYKYLNCIIVEKKEKTNETLRQLVMRTMIRNQNWVFLYFQPQPPAPEPEVEAEVYSSEEEMLAAFKRKEEAAAAKRKRSTEEQLTEEEPSNKKAKISETAENEEKEGLYDIPSDTKINPYYPTVMELMDFDNEVLKQCLITKFQIDKILVVPKLDEIIFQQSSLEKVVPNGFEVVGIDIEGKPSKIDLGCDNLATDQVVVRYIDNLENIRISPHLDEIAYWGGKDIRERWSLFSKQLDKIETEKGEKKKQAFPNFGQLQGCSLPVYLTAQEATVPTSLPDIQTVLASRGVSLVPQ